MIYNYIANRQRLRCVLQINERSKSVRSMTWSLTSVVTLSAFLFPVCSISTTTSQQPFFPFCILFRNFDALFDTLDDNLFRVRQAYQLLNPQGQEEAAKRIEELTEIPKYRESPSDKK